MVVLIIDTSARMVRVELEREGTVIEKREWESDRTLGRVLLEKISEVLEARKIGWNEIDQIAVIESGSGGSFMAQRTGIVTASMLAEANSKEVVVRKAP